MRHLHMWRPPRALRRALRRPLRRPGPDAGSAPIEFVFASVVLLIPLCYLVIALAQVQAASYATHTVAINAAKSVARQPESGRAQAQQLAELSFADFGAKPQRYWIRYSCAGDCTQAGSVITAHVRTEVGVPGIPLLFGKHRGPYITVVAEHSDLVAPHVQP